MIAAAMNLSIHAPKPSWASRHEGLESATLRIKGLTPW